MANLRLLWVSVCERIGKSNAIEEKGPKKTPKEMLGTSTWKGVFGRTISWMILCQLCPQKLLFALEMMVPFSGGLRTNAISII